MALRTENIVIPKHKMPKHLQEVLNDVSEMLSSGQSIPFDCPMKKLDGDLNKRIRYSRFFGCVDNGDYLFEMPIMEDIKKYEKSNSS